MKIVSVREESAKEIVSRVDVVAGATAIEIVRAVGSALRQMRI